MNPANRSNFSMQETLKIIAVFNIIISLIQLFVEVPFLSDEKLRQDSFLFFLGNSAAIPLLIYSAIETFFFNKRRGMIFGITGLAMAIIPVYLFSFQLLAQTGDQFLTKQGLFGFAVQFFLYGLIPMLVPPFAGLIPFTIWLGFLIYFFFKNKNQIV